MNLIDNVKDTAAEEALLGALIINPAELDHIALDGKEFSEIRNRLLYEAMRAVADNGGNLDFVTLQAELEKTGNLEKAGGIGRLIELSSACPNSINAEGYAAIIADKASRRRALHGLTKAVNAAADPGADFTAEIATLFDLLLKDSGSKAGAIPLGRVLGELWGDVQDAYENPREYFGIPTGLKGFDAITSGLQRGELMMLSGEPGVGKSSLAMQLVMGAAKRGVPGAVYQLEMRSLAVARRAIAYEAKVEAKKLRSGKLEAGEIDRFTRALGEFEKLPILISDRTDWTTLAMRADITKLKAQYNIGWVLIDYMALLKDDPGMDANERSAVISDRVHAIAKDFDVAVLAVHDMTKAGMTGQTNGQAALAGSRRVMYNADTIAMLTNTKEDNVLQLTWTKFREDAPNRVLFLSRAAQFAHFEETMR